MLSFGGTPALPYLPHQAPRPESASSSASSWVPDAHHGTLSPVHKDAPVGEERNRHTTFPFSSFFFKKDKADKLFIALKTEKRRGLL